MPTALAAPTLEARQVTLTGDTHLSGDAAALLAPTGTNVTWEVFAPRAHLVKLSSPVMSIDNPLVPEHAAYSKEPDWVEEDIELTDLLLTSADSTLDGALVVLGAAGSMEARTDGVVRLVSTTDPRIEQAPIDAEAPGADDGYIRERLEGEYLLASFPGGELTLTGDLTLILYGPGYHLSARDTESDELTGYHETDRKAIVAQGTMERHLYVLEDALVRIVSGATAQVYTTYPQISFDGTVHLDGSEGSLVLDGAESRAENGALVWTGATTLSLAPAAGRILATTPEPLVAAGGAVVAQGPRVALVSVALFLAVALALGAFILHRRNRAGDLDAALLAMEERRWNDALPHLTVIAKREPGNAGVQIDRALCLEQVGRFDDAAKAFEAALRSAPQHAEAHFYYARTLAKMRESEAARVHLEAALERDPRLVEMARTESVLRGL